MNMVIGIGGNGYCILAGDTRISGEMYNIMSRKISKVSKLTDSTYLASSGMFADFMALSKNLNIQLNNY